MRRPSATLLLLILPLCFDSSAESAATQGTHALRNEAGWATSDRCRSCHQDHYASWYRTYHRTMTQEVGKESVLGAFDGRRVTQWGKTVIPTQRDGRYFFDFLDQQGKLSQSFEVKRTVGSHRYQQYLTQVPGGGSNYYRIQFLWHVQDQRWVHLNAAFLGPDSQLFGDHVATWNHNCIFCHNTGPAPGISNLAELKQRSADGDAINLEEQGRYESSVAELGIACEACHGPGELHSRKNRNPLRRYYLHLSGADDLTITNPAKLEHTAATYVCGQCHGQRTPRSEHMSQWIDSGPTFRPGDQLTDHVNLVWQDSALPNQLATDTFSLRFWADGTPRLSAYELQGTLQSQCYQRGDLSCISCHTAHGGDPAGMLTAANRGNRACAQCHELLAQDLKAHTKHELNSSGSLCMNCHMPKIVYGVMEIHRSHRIEVPSAARDAANGRPNACTSCHLDKPITWAATAQRKLWPGSGTKPGFRLDGAPLASVDSIAQLWAGDPVQRAVAAALVGRDDSPLTAGQRAFLVPHLLGMLSHHYPSARRFAKISLLAIESALAKENIKLDFGQALQSFDYTLLADQRNPIIAGFWRQWLALPKQALPAPPKGAMLTRDYQLLDAPMAELLRLGEKNTQQIDIGE